MTKDFSFQSTNNRIAVSPSEGAILAGIGRTKFYELISSGELPSFKVGSRRLIRIKEIEEWMIRLEAQDA